MSSAVETALPAKQWNTKNLGRRMGADFLAAASAGLVVAPLISMIDRAIIENASSRATLRDSLRTSLRHLLTSPQTYLTSRPFRLVLTLYTGTYLAANTLDTFSSTLLSPAPASTVTGGTPKFLATSTANLSLCLYKDSQFTRLFGAVSNTPRLVPLPTYALFAARDCMTVFASFNLPPLIAPLLPISEGVEKWASRASVAQFLAPAACQIFSTPAHLLGLDLYNRPGVGWGSRGKRVVRDWGMSCLARVGRIVPAFGVGGVVNMRVRQRVMQGLE